MPSGSTHRAITKYLGQRTTPLVAIGVGLMAGPWAGLTAGFGYGLGVAITLKVGPDLDIHNSMGLLGRFMGFEAYKEIVPHRAGMNKKSWKFALKNVVSVWILSHIPFVGTLPRFILVMLPFAILVMLVETLQRMDYSWLLWVYLGMSISDSWHAIADALSSKFKRSDLYRRRNAKN